MKKGKREHALKKGDRNEKANAKKQDRKEENEKEARPKNRASKNALEQ